jgi:hypothetical protein
LAEWRIEAEIQEIVGQLGPRKVFGGKVPHDANVVVHVGVQGTEKSRKDPIANGVGNGLVIITRDGVFGRPPYNVKQIVEDGALKGFHA